LITDDVKNDIYRQAELILYDSCKSLPDNWFVLYGVAWLSERATSVGSTEGECDFIIVGSDIGLLFIEVKGGRIGKDADGWHSYNRQGLRFSIKDPIQQATKAKHHIINMLRSSPHFAKRYLPAGIMACFPHTKKSEMPFLLELPRAAILSADDLGNLEQAIRRASQIYMTSNDRKPTPAECVDIANYLKPSFEGRSRWSTIAKMQKLAIDNLTAEQAAVFECTKENTRIGLSGPAGSGKTILAMKWAQTLLAEQKSLLVLTPTPLLEKYYKTMLTGFGTCTFAGSSVKQVEAFGGERSPSSSFFDAVLIEEGQNIMLESWVIIDRIICQSNNPRLLVIYDANQKMKHKDDIYLPDALAYYRLNRIIRNTAQIAKVSKSFFSNESFSPSITGPDGVDVQFIALAKEEYERNTIAQIVHDLTRKHDFELRDIVVLYYRGEGNAMDVDRHMSHQLILGARSGWEADNDQWIVPTMSIRDFIGMESPVVILTELDKWLDKELIEACYIGVSRARYVLCIVASPETLVRIKSLVETG
jgi:hypothetical protein